MPLGAAAAMAGLGALLAKEGYKRQAALDLGKLGLNIGYLPVQQMQQEQAAMMKQGLESGELTTQAPGPDAQPVAQYGGRAVYQAPRTTIADLYPGTTFPGSVGRLPITAATAAQFAYPAAREAEEAAFYETQPDLQGKPFATQREIYKAKTGIDLKIASMPRFWAAAQDVTKGLPPLRPGETREITTTPGGMPQVKEGFMSEADRVELIAERAAKRQAEQGRLDVIRAQLATENKRLEGELELAKLRAADPRNNPRFQAIKMELEGIKGQQGNYTEMMSKLVDSTGLPVPGKEPAYNELGNKFMALGNRIDSLLTEARQLGTTPDQAGAVPAAPQPPADPNEAQRARYMSEIIGLTDPTKRTQYRPKDPAQAAIWDEADRDFMELVNPVLDDLKAHMAGRNYLQQGSPDPQYEQIMRARHGAAYDAALNLWKNQPRQGWLR